MADYYPLLARAVSGLKESNPAARAAIYERARKALLGQLRHMDPPAPEVAIEREAQALDAAIARLELEYAAKPEPEPRPESEHSPESGPSPESKPELEREPKATLEPEVQAAPEEASAEAAPEAKADSYDEPKREPEGSTEEAAAARDDDKNLRPAAPKPRASGRAGLRRFAILFGALAAVAAVVALAAWTLRDRPEDLAKLAPPAASDSAGDAKGDGKIAVRVGDATPAPAGDSAPKPVTVQTVPIAYRAAVLMQAPSEPGGVKTFVGSVVWRRLSVNRGPDNQLAAAIGADIVVPDAGFKASLTIEKNYDASLSASHTISIHFDPAPDSPIGDVKTINVPELRRDDAPRGAPLQGMQVDVAPNVFIVGLYSSAETQNIDMLRNLTWIDVPMSLASGKIAKLTFEKGAVGAQIVNDVFSEWQGVAPK